MKKATERRRVFFFFFFLTHSEKVQSFTEGKSKLKESEAAGLTAFRVRKHRAVNEGCAQLMPSFSYRPGSQSPRDVVTNSGNILPTQQTSQGLYSTDMPRDEFD